MVVLMNRIRGMEYRPTRTLVACTVAAALVVAVTLLVARSRTLALPASGRPELRELAAALRNETHRPLAARLSADFEYAPSASATRGDDRTISSRVLSAIARLEETANQREDARQNAALAVGYIIAGRWDSAIELLDAAVRQEPRNADWLIDLSAAYVARAASGSLGGDWARGLAAANRAIRAAPQRPEAHFNRALALEGLHLAPSAIDAWTESERLDRGAGWAVESAFRARELATRHEHRATAGENRRTDNQHLRERIEDVLLPEWAAAFVAGSSATAAARLDEAETLAYELARAGGDGMAEDAIRLIRRAQRRGLKTSVSAMARGHALYGRARAAYLVDNQREAAALMAGAAREFRVAQSPYAAWEHVFEAIARRTEGSPEGSLQALSQIGVESLPLRHVHLRSRHAWAYAVARDEQGRFDIGVQSLTRAADGFREAGERGNLARTLAILAEAEWSLGDHETAWRHALEVLEDVDRGNLASHNYHLAVAAKLSLSAGLPEAALEFDNLRVSAARTPRAKVEALQRRARTLVLVGDMEAAARDIERAADAVGHLADPALRERNAADVNIARAEVYSLTDLKRSVAAADAALEYVRRADPAFTLGRLLAVRGRGRQALGDEVGAEADFVAAINAFEAKRRNLTSTADRLRAFDYERAAFKQLIRFEAVTRSDAAAALRMAERSRVGGWMRWSGESVSALDPTTAHATLPRDVAIVYYETLDDRVLVWVLTREKHFHFSRPIALSDLARQVSRIERAIQRGATVDTLDPLSGPLVSELIQPALAAADRAATVIFVPDGPLYSLPFAALPVEGEPLIALRTVGVVPSFTTFLRATSDLRAMVPDDVLAVGAGHDPHTTGLSALPFADDEARAVGALYPRHTVLSGAAATVTRVLGADHTVMHFAGHTVVNREFPLFSRLFLAPESGDPGVLLASQVLDHQFRSTRVVVLATCEAAAGTVIDGEGIVSVARAFLAAGVPAVVASLWPVEDDNHDLFTTFHRELRARRDAAAALRAAQLAILRRAGTTAPIRSWGGIAAFGGVAVAHK
jgi:CHAT domain-containing protein